MNTYPSGARTLRLASTRGLRPGATVVVRRIGNQAWSRMRVGMSAPNTTSPMAPVQRRLGSRRRRSAGQHHCARCTHYLRHRKALGRRLRDEQH